MSTVARLNIEMAAKKMDPVIKGRVVQLLKLNWSTSMIIRELKKTQVSCSAATISRIRNKTKNPHQKKVCRRGKSKKRGRPVKVNRTTLDRLRKMVKSENPPSQRNMARLLKIPLMTVNYHIRNTLKMHVRLKQNVHVLSEGSVVKRRQRSWPFYRFLLANLERIVTSDEAWFYLSGCNGQRRIYYAPKGKMPQRKCATRKPTHSKGVMVWGGVSMKGKTSLRFIRPGAKIDSTYYVTEVLKPFVKTDLKRLYPNGDAIFHQDSAPAHVAKNTLKFFADSKLAYVDPESWMPQSPDLAPMDYFVWGYLKQQLWKRKVTTINGLKRALLDEWKKLPQEMINRALIHWKKRCRLTYYNKGRQIEQFH